MSNGLVVFNQWTPIPSCGGGSDMLIPMSEPVTVTALNTFAPLSQTPFPGPITLTVNGRSFFSVGPDAAFSVNGQQLTWISETFSVNPGDEVVAVYYYVV
jgi:hypothetical protein